MREFAADPAQCKGLYIEHYPGMTEKSLLELAQTAQQRWALSGVRVIHRVGQLAPGSNCIGGHRRPPPRRLRRLRMVDGYAENPGALLETRGAIGGWRPKPPTRPPSSAGIQPAIKRVHSGTAGLVIPRQAQ